MNELEKIKKKINDKELVIGTGVTFSDSSITELLGNIGFDYIWIDIEHPALDKKDTQLHIIAARASGTASFVRIPWNDFVLAKPILDMGPSAIIFPFIKTAKEAEAAVKSARYPLNGVRGFGPIRANKYGLIETDKYIKESDSNIWKIMMIEHIEAVKNIDAILEVEGVDAIVVGPCDLSGSVGLLGQTDRYEIKKLMDIIGQKAVKSGKPFGVATGYNPEVIREWLYRGINWIAVDVDFNILQKYAREIFEGTKTIFSEFGNS
ncbi:MAG: hypothetical protein FJW69_00400 [Actinobacteria bacterium]|nr:hypothetical protein [Actinomycetota bacterium]MBM3712039.1 hypothetical protein [Actinomycetota bacterium]